VKPGYKRTAVGVIPEDWDAKRLGEIAELKSGYAFKSETYTDLGTYRIITIANVQDGYMDLTDCSKTLQIPRDLQPHQRLERSELLISMTGNVGRVCRVSEDNCLLNQRVGKLIPSEVVPAFLYYLLGQRDFIISMATKAKGGAQGNISVSDITEYVFRVPNSRDEQHAIAAALSDVDALISALDKLIAKKRDIKQAAMQQLLTGKKRLPGFDGAWEVQRLGEMAELKNGYAFKSSTYSAAGDFKIITIGNVQDGYLDTKECNRIAAIPRDIQPHQLLRRGDHLISMTGNVGRVCCVDEDNCLLNQRVGKLIPTSVDQTFFYHLTRQERFISSMILKAKGGAQGNLGVSDITHFEFPVPVASAEQQSIAAILSDMDAEISALETRRDKTRALKQGMMQELLTGRTRLV